MPLFQSTLHVGLADSNLGHPDLVQLADSLGHGLISLSGDVLNFVKENKQLYMKKERLENIKYPGKVFVNGGSVLIDVQDFIALSSFLNSAERLMKTNLYKTRIATHGQHRKSAAKDARSTVATVDTDSGVNAATPTPPAKHRSLRHAAKRHKTSHSSQNPRTLRSSISVDAPLIETTENPKGHKGRLPQLAPLSERDSRVPHHVKPPSISAIATPIKRETLRSNTTGSNTASSENIITEITNSPDTKESPPTKSIRLEPIIPVDGTESTVAAMARAANGGAGALTVDQGISSTLIAQLRPAPPRTLRRRKSLGRL